jgi:peptidoglycan/LPS O-acetylase OafA/YrhL
MTICVVCIVLVPIARIVALAHMPEALISGDVVFHATPFRFDTLLVGALIALLYRGVLRERLQRIAQAILVAATLCILLLIAYWIFFRSFNISDLAVRHTWLLSLIGLFSGALMLRTLIPGTIPYRVFHLRWLRRVGMVSYGAYVFHDIPHDVYQRFVADYAHHRIHDLTAVIGIVMTLLMAFLSYHFFELPILRLKDRFTSNNAVPAKGSERREAADRAPIVSTE